MNRRAFWRIKRQWDRKREVKNPCVLTVYQLFPLRTNRIDGITYWVKNVLINWHILNNLENHHNRTMNSRETNQTKNYKQYLKKIKITSTLITITEKRTTSYNIVKLLKYELFILCTYLKNNNKSIGFITSFNDKLSLHWC